MSIYTVWFPGKLQAKCRNRSNAAQAVHRIAQTMNTMITRHVLPSGSRLISLIRRTPLLSAILLMALQPVEAATITMQIHLGPGATGEDWYQMALWLEDPQGHYAETLYVTADVGREGLGNGFWRLFGLTVREAPESLPVWAHRRGVRYGESYYPPREKPLPDAVTGATIKQSSIIRAFDLDDAAAQRMGTDPWHCLLELNVSRDGTPSMVFEAIATANSAPAPFRFMGYGDQKGRDGTLHGGEANPAEFVQEASCTIANDMPGQARP
jgi:hypothetical protein